MGKQCLLVAVRVRNTWVLCSVIIVAILITMPKPNVLAKKH